MSDPDRIREALGFVSPDCDRDSWVRALMAIKAELGEDGRVIAEQWSMGADSYDRRDFATTWKSIRPNGKTTGGTLFHEAQARGWPPKFNGSHAGPSPEELAERKRRAVEREAQDQAERKARADAAAALAVKAWDSASDDRVGDHAYLVSKGVGAHGVRIGAWPKRTEDGDKIYHGALLVPLRDVDGHLLSLQAIWARDPGIDRTKDFIAGGRKTGAMHCIGELDGAMTICIAEGYATAASVHEATGLPVVVAFDAGNLLPVAKALRGKYQSARLVFCADDDYQTKGNPGMTKATEAARAVGGLLAVPDFGPERPDGATDFNDLAQRRGAEAVRQAIEGARAPEPDAKPETAQTRDAAFRELSKRIGEGGDIDPADLLPRVWMLDEMLAEAVFLADGAQVALRGDPRTAVSFGHFELRTAASVRKTRSGQYRLVARDWLENHRRVTVHTLTFAPGAPEICRSPDDHIALNLWRHVPLADVPDNWPEHAVAFLRHVSYLVPIDEERGLFLDWLAHLEQRPGELPHFHWLFIANTHGIGRNLLAAWLARVWRGYVALGVDLPALTSGGFNGSLSRKLLAQVDELNEVATVDRGSIYRAAETLKSLLTRERTLINPKYGRQHVEFNAMRWLMFSNHDSALYLDERDRRFCVIRNPDRPQAPEYYAEMYQRCADQGFIASIRKLLCERDIRTFNPGRLPDVNQAKADVIAAGRSDIDQAMLDLAEWWPGEIVTATDIRRFVFPGIEDDDTEAARRESGALRHAAARAGLKPLHQRIRISGKRERVWTLRNPEKWARAKPSTIAAAAENAAADARQKEYRDAAGD